MKVLFVSDKVVQHLYGQSVTRYRSEVALVVGCGDLPYYYLEYLQSMLDTPLFFVHGNHDPDQEYLADGTIVTGPMGGINLHRHCYNERNLLMAGLEGSIRYRKGSFQYSQFEMWLHCFYLVPHLLLNNIRYGRYLDLFIAHSPPYGIHNGEDHVHVGFKSFLWLMKRFKPRYMMHGHRHVYHSAEITETEFEETTVINIYPYKVIDIEVSS